jgi:hypothetical protein
VGRRALWDSQKVPRLAVLCTALALLTTVAAQASPERLTGVVTPTIGVRVDGAGAISGTGGTQPVTVTRERRDAGVVVTVTPAF